ncbi:MAG: hypothetical protein IT385_18695 [Deltaproteobacteria bacterium]|nr:hypothetical protein [Deltaproteobacteria bacterium]
MKNILTGLSLVIAVVASACGGDESNNGGTDTTGGNSCTKNEDCVGKVTTGPCRQAACNSQTKQCEAAPVSDGTTCSTGNACTVGESCTAGTCAGGSTKPADCGSRECGNDACGNACGSCTGTETCSTAGMCEEDPTACGDVTFEGCCTADGQLKYCLEGALEVIDCGENEVRSACGWLEASGGFDCADQGEPAPDSETYPYLCSGETAPTNPCAGRECGFAFGVACGNECGQGLACDSAGKCTDPCLDKECGEFGGKTCGACQGDDVCSAEGQCVENQCGTLRYEGCCDGDVTFWCEDNEVTELDCQAEYEVGCGWVPFDAQEGDGDFYFCGGEGDDPSGTLLKACSEYDFVRPGEVVEPGPEVAPEVSPEPAAEEAPEAGPEPEPEASPEATTD